MTYFENAFDQASARKEGKDYLKEQKRHFGCEIKYWGTGKNRFQLEVPAAKLSKANDDYELASGTKNVKRYVTVETKQFLERQMAAEDQRDKALMD